MTDPTKRLLIVDDEAPICTLIEKIALPLGFVVEKLNDPTAFAARQQNFSPTLLFLDLKMPGVDGVQLLNQLKNTDFTAPVVLMSGMDQRVLTKAETLAKSHGLNILGVLRKPFRREDVEAFLRRGENASDPTTADLEQALANHEFVVHYQPKISQREDGWIIKSSEALVRWQHPGRGLLLPGKFLPTMESGGLIGPLTDFVLDSVIRQLAAWSAQKIDMKVAVNLSAQLIGDTDFPDRLNNLLKEHGVAGSQLILELTESAAMADATKAMDILLRLRVNDISLSIDDFGAGFSSLQQLYQLPFDELKIDRMFVSGLPEDDEAKAIVHAMIQMAHALTMKVCAEGVETLDALRFLESVDCDRAQGFLVSPAVPAGEFVKILRQGSAEWSSKAA